MIRTTIAGDIVELRPDQKPPKRGLAICGALLYEDGRTLGVATLVEWVMDVRADFVLARYRRMRDA